MGSPDPYDELAISVSQPFELDQRRHVEQVRVARDVGYVPRDGERRCLGHTLHSAVATDTEKHATALAIGERADDLERVLSWLGLTALELNAYALASLDVSIERDRS